MPLGAVLLNMKPAHEQWLRNAHGNEEGPFMLGP